MGSNMELQGKKVIITGGASGFGSGISEKCIENGATIIIADINKSLAIDKANELGENAHSISTDVSNENSVKNLKIESEKIFGDPDIIINNAGVTHNPDFIENISNEEFERVLNVNVKSVFLMSKEFVPQMKKRQSGVILNIASTAGISPRPKLTWYNSTKGWMITATKSLAIELAPFKIRVNAINPVAGETPLLKTFMGEDTPEMRAKFLSTIPLGRFSSPEDMGNAAVFLCSEKASMITGVALEVDGGRCI